MRFDRRAQTIAVAVAITLSAAGSPMAQTAPQTPSPSGPVTLPQAPADTGPRRIDTSQFTMADGIVATVNDQVITGYDLRQRMLSVIAQSQIQPTQENLPAIQQQALDTLIDERVQTEELRNYEDLVISDEEVEEEIGNIAQEAGVSKDAYLAFLTETGIRPSTFREQLRTEIAWRALVNGRFNSRSRVSKAQVEQTMRQVAEASSKPQYLIGEIYIEAARVGGQQAALNGARQLITQMTQGAPFQNVAQQFSAAPSAVRGGDAGWVVQGTVAPQLQAALDTLQVGELSQPVPVEGGVYIVYMRDKRAGNSTSLVQLKQVMVEVPQDAPDTDTQAATARLQSIRSDLTCDNILPRATSETGLLGADLGEADVDSLAPQFQQAARSGEIGSISEPIRTPLGVHLLAVCGRRSGAPDAPTFQQVENRLQSQNLANLGRRYIRDLRADALIDFK